MPAMSHMQRASSIAAVSALVLFGAAGAAIAQDAEPGTAEGATTVRTGWWWRANDKPDTGNLDPGKPPVPTVPEGALPVSVAAGEHEKVSALQFALDAEPGDTVTSFVLALRESDSEGANAGAEAPTTVVAACQITESFWAPEDAAEWGTRPGHDDGSCVPGLRAEDGIWTFDLTPLATRWLATDSELSASVLLVPQQGDVPPSFQVTYDGVADEGVGLHATIESARLPGDQGTDEATPITPETGTGTAAGGFDAAPPADASAPGTDAVDPPAAGQAPQPGEAPTAVPEGGKPAEPRGPALAARPGPSPPGLADGIPPAVWLLIPVVLGGAVLMTIGLGPRGEPMTGAAGRGVGRALERWRAGTGPEGAV